MLHIGGVRTALFSWLYARRRGGKFILRVEDTDRERSTDEAVRVILEGMRWLGLNEDEGPFYQTQRYPRYQAVIEQMLAQGLAYRCYASKEELDAMREAQLARKEKPRYDGRWRDSTATPPPGVTPVIRFRNPLAGEVVVEDLVHGRTVFQNTELDDLIIQRSDGNPTYNFCVVVDDMDMGVTHVIRGDDHLNNTPRQINMLVALGAKPPIYAHVPMILGADGAKLSKRHGAVSVLEYEKDGYLPDALLNYLVRLGWSHGDQEFFTREEMIAAFDIASVNKAASAFNRRQAAVAQPAAHHQGAAGHAGGRLARAAGHARRHERQRRLAGRRGRGAARAGEDDEGDGAGQPVLLPRAGDGREGGGQASDAGGEGVAGRAARDAGDGDGMDGAGPACGHTGVCGGAGAGAGEGGPAAARGADGRHDLAADRCDAGLAGA